MDRPRIDPHLHYSVPVKHTHKRADDPSRWWRMARFWYTTGDGRAMIVVWPRFNVAGRERMPEPLCLALHELRVSDDPADPPAMPTWAREVEEQSA